MPETTRILVTGASGHVGSEVVRLLRLDPEVEAVACVRDRERVDAGLPGVPVVIADYEDPSTLAAAFVDCAVLCFVPGDGFAEDMLRQNRNVVNAAIETGVEHFVFLSILETGDRSNFYFAPVYREAESRITQAFSKWTILRSGLYSDFFFGSIVTPALAKGELAVPAEEASVSLISRNDVARALAAATGRAAGKIEATAIYSLTGSETLSMNQIADQTSAADGRPLVYRSIDPESYHAMLKQTLSEPWPVAFSTLFDSIRSGKYAASSSDFLELTGRRPESYDEFLARNR